MPTGEILTLVAVILVGVGGLCIVCAVPDADIGPVKPWRWLDRRYPPGGGVGAEVRSLGQLPVLPFHDAAREQGGVWRFPTSAHFCNS
jgi:hypothetical protein